MAKLIFRQAAINDLNDIWKYTLIKWSEKQADKYYASLESACQQIGKNPELGTQYAEINSHLLGFKIGNHIIFYQVNTDHHIEIIRILHQRMDLFSKLEDE
jgi:toxin ParE1/3/4